MIKAAGSPSLFLSICLSYQNKENGSGGSGLWSGGFIMQAAKTLVAKIIKFVQFSHIANKGKGMNIVSLFDFKYEKHQNTTSPFIRCSIFVWLCLYTIPGIKIKVSCMPSFC